MGSSTVLIGGLPAARLGDHVFCPLFTPAGLAQIPHVGGPIVTGSTTVLINGMPAARIGDLHSEVGPGAAITTGLPTVLIGG